MSEQNEIIPLFDEEGNQTDFVVLDGVELDGKEYLMLVEADCADDPEADALILRIDTEDDEDVLVTIEDEAEFEAVSAVFAEHYEDDEEYSVETAQDDVE